MRSSIPFALPLGINASRQARQADACYGSVSGGVGPGDSKGVGVAPSGEGDGSGGTDVAVAVGLLVEVGGMAVAVGPGESACSPPKAVRPPLAITIM